MELKDRKLINNSRYLPKFGLGDEAFNVTVNHNDKFGLL